MSSSSISMKGVDLHGRPLYLDMQATTPVDPRVLDAMLPYFVDSYGNPHSRTHMYGWEAEEAIEGARADVAAAIGANPKEIIFTSGATESNNMAIKGVARFYESTILPYYMHERLLGKGGVLPPEAMEMTRQPM